MTDLNSLKAQLLPFVRRHACLKLPEPIKLASGRMSDTYFDGRQVTLHPEGASLLARCILERVSLDELDAVGGPCIGADPIVTAVSLFAWLEKKVTLPAFLVRKEPKQHGLQKQIEGTEIKKGMKVLMVEDVITTGISVLNAVQVVEHFGAEVVQIACLVDREEGGAETLNRYLLTPVFTKSEIDGTP